MSDSDNLDASLGAGEKQQFSNSIKGGAPIAHTSADDFNAVRDVAEDFRSDWEATRKAKSKVEANKSGDGKQIEPKGKAGLDSSKSKLEAMLKAELGESEDSDNSAQANQSTGEDDASNGSEEDSAQAKSDGKTQKEIQEKPKAGFQKKIDRLVAKHKDAEEKADRFYKEKLALEEKFKIFQKEYEHLEKLTRKHEDPKDVELRALKYQIEMEKADKNVSERINKEKSKAVEVYQRQQQEQQMMTEATELAEKYFMVSQTEILMAGIEDLRPLAEIAKELHLKKAKRAGIESNRATPKPPKTAANVGSSVRDIDFDDSPEGMKAFLRSKGRL